MTAQLHILMHEISNSFWGAVYKNRIFWKRYTNYNVRAMCTMWVPLYIYFHMISALKKEA
jgi:hypothetical protein